MVLADTSNASSAGDEELRDKGFAGQEDSPQQGLLLLGHVIFELLVKTLGT